MTYLKFAAIAAFMTAVSAGATTTASAEGIRLTPSNNSGFSIEFNWDRVHQHDHRHYHKFKGKPRHYGYCNPRKAVKKARRKMGLRHVHVIREGRRGVLVSGYRHGQKLKVRFAHRKSCPIAVIRPVYEGRHHHW